MQVRQVQDIEYHHLPGTARMTTDIVIERDGMVTVRPPARMTPEQIEAERRLLLPTEERCQRTWHRRRQQGLRSVLCPQGIATPGAASCLLRPQGGCCRGKCGSQGSGIPLGLMPERWRPALSLEVFDGTSDHH